MSMSSKERRALAKAIRRAPPPDLRRRLLAIPETTPRPARHGRRWLAASAAFATLALAITTFLLVPALRTPEPSAEEIAAEAAVRDFTVAMVYLRRTTEIAGRHADDEIGRGMRDALTISRDALRESNTSNGG